MNTAIIVAAASHNSKRNKSNKKSNILSDMLKRECEAYAETQTPHFMYKVVPMTKEEMERHPDNQ